SETLTARNRVGIAKRIREACERFRRANRTIPARLAQTFPLSPDAFTQDCKCEADHSGRRSFWHWRARDDGNVAPTARKGYARVENRLVHFRARNGQRNSCAGRAPTRRGARDRNRQ